MKRIIFAIAVIVAASVSTAFPQSANQANKLRIAQALEEAGEYTKAQTFFRELYESDPGNFVYFDGLRRSYMNLKQYKSAAALIRARLESEPKNISLYCELGDAYFKGGAQDSAIDAWNDALKIDPKNPGTYQAVAGIMTQDRLFDRAIAVYRKGENATNYKTGFVIQIARLYFYGMNYKESLRELLKLFVSDNKTAAVAYIESQLGEYSTSKQVIDQFIEEMKKQVNRNSGNIYYRRILAFLYMERKDYTAAYDVYKWLDDHTGSKGIELLAFGERAYNDEAYLAAAKAYEEVSRLSKAESVVSKSIMGYANSFRMLGERELSEDNRPCASNDTLAYLNAALGAYGRIIKDFPKTGFYAPSVLNSIEIRMNYLDDLKGAELLFTEIGKIPRAYDQEATLARIELDFKEGTFEKALKVSLGGLAGIGPDRTAGGEDKNFQDRLKYEAAHALFYLGNFDSASHYLRQIIADPMSDAANEAIRLSDLIENNKGMPQALKEYSIARSLEVSGRLPEAVLQFENVLDSYPQMPLASDAAFDLAGVYCKMGNVSQALKVYKSLARDSVGVFADQAQFRMAKIYEVTLHDSKKAVEEYESFLARFPDSIYQIKVRDILRRLLGPNS